MTFYIKYKYIVTNFSPFNYTRSLSIYTHKRTSPAMQKIECKTRGPSGQSFRERLTTGNCIRRCMREMHSLTQSTVTLSRAESPEYMHQRETRIAPLVGGAKSYVKTRFALVFFTTIIFYFFFLQVTHRCLCIIIFFFQLE